MADWLIFIYLLAVAGALLSIFLIFRLQKHYRHAFLTPFLYFVILDAIMTVADLFMRLLPMQLHWFGPKGIPGKFILLLNYFIFPIAIFMSFFFILAISKLVNLNLPRWLFRAFWGCNILLFTLYLAGLTIYLGSGDRQLLVALLPIADGSPTFYLVAILLAGLFRAAFIKERPKRRFLLFLCSYYLFFFILYYFGNVLRIGQNLIIIIGSLAYNMPIVLLLARQLRANFQPIPEQAPGWTFATDRFAESGMSKREREIVNLVLQGRSNREIEDVLFISRRTVENHVYKIYRKLGVKNRLQLSQLLKDGFAGQRFPDMEPKEK
jgi:DNA-binding CsgD family transcriptional regulator